MVWYLLNEVLIWGNVWFLFDVFHFKINSLKEYSETKSLHLLMIINTKYIKLFRHCILYVTL